MQFPSNVVENVALRFDFNAEDAEDFAKDAEPESVAEIRVTPDS